ncbi:Protein argonaute 5 [Beauveria bassiana]|nr:Protein argonaute 5 [Beauveria bassiana]
MFRGARANDGRGRGGFRGDRGSRGRGAGQQGVQIFANLHPQNPKVGQAEDTLHPITKKALGFDRLSIGDRLPIRPGYGTKGVRVELTANYVELLPPSDVALYRYSIQIKPEPVRRKQFRLVELLLQSAELAPQRGELATDFRSTLLSKMKLSSDDFTVKVQYRAEGEDEPPAGAANYAVQVAYTTTLRMSDLMNYLASTSIDERFDERSEWEQTFNIFLNHYAKATKTLVAIGASKTFSLSQHTGQADLGSGLQVLRGFFSSVRIATGRVLVNLNVSHAAFYHAGPLPVLMNSYGVRSTTALENFLKLVRIQTTHLPEKRNKAGEIILRLKTIFGLARKDDGHGLAHPPRISRHGAGAKDVQFWLERDAPPQNSTAARGATDKKSKAKGKSTAQPDTSESGKYISVFDFFKTTYNRTLRHPELPLVNCGNRAHPMYLPAEVCEVIHGQPSRSKLDSSQTQQMIRHAVRKPWINAASIAAEGISTVGLDGNSNVLLGSFSFGIKPGLIKVPGRILDCPQITYKSVDKGTKIADPRFGSWNMLNIKFNAGAVLSQWSYMMVSLAGLRDPFDQKSLADVMQEFRQALVNMGVNAVPPMPGQRLLLQHTDDAALGTVLQKAANALKLLVIILPDANTPLYKRIKSLADKTYGIHTVCCVGPKLAKAHGRDQYIANVALKLNLKLGGVNQIMGDRQLGIIGQDKTMVVGIDVTHPSPGSSSNAPSVSAMVASIDRFLGQWPATLRTQSAKQEKVDDLGDMLKSRLQLWRSLGKHAAFPENILVYRDGVSEGQHDMVTSQELPQLRHACEQLYSAVDTRKGLPRFTVIICGKRHKTRFYPTLERDCDRSGNTKPGTIVDRGVTEARNWDFFLQAHAALQGTARPCHYYIVHDEIFRQLYAKAIPTPFQNIADIVEDLTHKMCYSFGRATKAVSLCTPAYYADIVCERARCYLADVFDTPSASAAASVAETTMGQGGATPNTSDVQIHDRLRDTMFYI